MADVLIGKFRDPSATGRKIYKLSREETNVGSLKNEMAAYEFFSHNLPKESLLRKFLFPLDQVQIVEAYTWKDTFQVERVIRGPDHPECDESYYGIIFTLFEKDDSYISLSKAKAKKTLGDPLALDASLAEMLQALASVPLIHGDISPGNVLVSARAGEIEALRLIDFGFASPALFDWDRPRGTPQFVSPSARLGFVSVLTDVEAAMALVRFMFPPADSDSDAADADADDRPFPELCPALCALLSPQADGRPSFVPPEVLAHLRSLRPSSTPVSLPCGVGADPFGRLEVRVAPCAGPVDPSSVDIPPHLRIHGRADSEGIPLAFALHPRNIADFRCFALETWCSPWESLLYACPAMENCDIDAVFIPSLKSPESVSALGRISVSAKAQGKGSSAQGKGSSSATPKHQNNPKKPVPPPPLAPSPPPSASPAPPCSMSPLSRSVDGSACGPRGSGSASGAGKEPQPSLPWGDFQRSIETLFVLPGDAPRDQVVPCPSSISYSSAPSSSLMSPSSSSSSSSLLPPAPAWNEPRHPGCMGTSGACPSAPPIPSPPPAPEKGPSSPGSLPLPLSPAPPTPFSPSCFPQHVSPHPSLREKIIVAEAMVVDVSSSTLTKTLLDHLRKLNYFLKVVVVLSLVRKECYLPATHAQNKPNFNMRVSNSFELFAKVSTTYGHPQVQLRGIPTIQYVLGCVEAHLVLPGAPPHFEDRVAELFEQEEFSLLRVLSYAKQFHLHFPPLPRASIQTDWALDTLGSRMSALEGSLKADMSALDSRMSALEGSLKADMSALEGSLKADMSALDSRMSALESTLSSKLEQILQKLTSPPSSSETVPARRSQSPPS